MAKRFLEEHNIEFEYIDVSQDDEAAREMIEKSGQTSVPVIDANGKIIIGFNKDALKKEINIHD